MAVGNSVGITTVSVGGEVVGGRVPDWVGSMIVGVWDEQATRRGRRKRKESMRRNFCIAVFYTNLAIIALAIFRRTGRGKRAKAEE